MAQKVMVLAIKTDAPSSTRQHHVEGENWLWKVAF